MSTPAISQLTQTRIEFQLHEYEYQPHGGTRVSSRALGVAEYEVIKTLVMEDEQGEPVIILMHGTLEVDEKAFAKAAGKKKIKPCKPEIANRHTGYLVGGTSPFGLKKKIPLFMERSILELEKIYINAGRRGLLISLTPGDLVQILEPTQVTVGKRTH